jgi:cAMP-dependent protein kinase regulator
MIQWLQKYSGRGINGETLDKVELKHIHRELKYYKKKYEKEDKDIIILSDEEEKEKESKEDQEKIDEAINKKLQKKRIRRITFSDEALSEKKQSGLIDFVPEIEEKSEEVINKIKEKCKSLDIFKNLSKNELELIINSFKTEKFQQGDTIFKQGEDGDKLYILISGELECWKTIKKGDPQTFIKLYNEGDILGELAIMYNYQRNYTIKAKTDAVLYTLDRKSYKGIIKGTELKQREKYKEALKNVDILENLNKSEFSKVCDIMVEKEFKSGEEILKQNVNDDYFCILYEGKCHSEKLIDTGKGPQILKEYNPNDYFGEAPWFKNELRSYSVKADTDCVVFFIIRKEFKRLIDCLENILKRKIEDYQKFMKK